MSTTVKNLTSPRSGEPVKNQFVIDVDGVETFQSYQTAIAKNRSGMFTISSNYNYSVTTSRYFNQWLKSYGLDDNDIAHVKKWLKTAKHGDTDYSTSRYSLYYVDSL